MVSETLAEAGKAKCSPGTCQDDWEAARTSSVPARKRGDNTLRDNAGKMKSKVPVKRRVTTTTRHLRGSCNAFHLNLNADGLALAVHLAKRLTVPGQRFSVAFHLAHDGRGGAGFGSAQRIVQRLRGTHTRFFLGHGNCQDANLFVGRQGQRLCVRRQIHGIDE